jgi:hypothetical protein
VNSITYRGPSLTTLHESYAKNRKIDEQAPIRGRRRIAIDAPVEVVWETLADLPCWGSILEPDLKVINAPDGIVPDAEFTRTIRRANITARFAVVDPNRELAWTGSAFGANVVHRFVLEPDGDDRTIATVEESMAGRMLGTFFSAQKLLASLETSLRGLKRAAEARAAERAALTQIEA